ncbi:MAG: DUF2267 domain-containing protein [Candidatus Altiarchaeota archaeon]|nr:DUF2267 domain-containing protein [Candidatus Altiarchaeota archaeon]
MRWKEFVGRVGKHAEIEDEGRAEAAARAVFHALSARLTIREGEDTRAQLPREIKAVWDEVRETSVDVIKFGKEEFLEKVRSDADLNDAAEAEKAVAAVFRTLKEQVSEGEAGDVAAQLPLKLKKLWLES